MERKTTNAQTKQQKMKMKTADCSYKRYQSQKIKISTKVNEKRKVIKKSKECEKWRE